MNANELADELFKEKKGICHVAATMLRQQHKELEHMWMANTVLEVELEALKAKTLTDEEIESWITEWAKDLYGTLYVKPTDHQRTMAIKMARAILRKAQE